MIGSESSTTAENSRGEQILRVENLTKRFPGVVALDDVSFDLRAGEVHVLLGENGAGKSTLIKCLSGVYQADSGRIFLNGQPAALTGTAAALELGIATIYQEFNLIPELSVAENVMLGRQPRSLGIINKRAMRRSAATALDRVGLGHILDEKVSALGVARQQLVEIAKALSQNARILILDEPTAALTDDEVDRLLALMNELRDDGVGMIFISHHLSEIRDIGDRVTVLRDGSTVATVEASLPETELVQLMVGRSISDQFPRRRSTPGRPILDLRNLTARGRFADINITVHEGEVVGLAGLVGAGRTEVLRAAIGVDAYESGQVLVSGVPLKRHDLRSALRAGVGLVPEDRKLQGLVLGLSVAENLALVNLPDLTRTGLVNRAALRRQADRSVRDLRIRASGIDQVAGTLSGGNQQKVVLGKWLNTSTSVMLLDEPTRGVDVGARVELYELINQMTSDGKGVLMVSSDLPEVIGMCDRIVVMAAGKITGEITHSNASQDLVMELAVKKVESTRVH